MVLAFREAKVKCGTGEVYTLSRNNITSNAMKTEINGTGLNSKLLVSLKYIDSNYKRFNLVYSCIKAIAFAKEKKFKDSIKELEKYFNYKTDKIEGKKNALRYITLLLSKYNEFECCTLYEFSSFLRNNLKSDHPNFKAGTIKDYYNNNTFKQLQLCVTIPEDISLHKTIHKAKGDEFDNVLIVLREEKDLEFLINPDLFLHTQKSEEHRVNYVAISRAVDRLFITVPSLANNTRDTLEPYFDIENV